MHLNCASFDNFIRLPAYAYRHRFENQTASQDRLLLIENRRPRLYKQTGIYAMTD